MDISVDQALLEILRCPACDDRPRVEPKDGALTCVQCRNAYPVKDGIPYMIVEEAVKAEEQK